MYFFADDAHQLAVLLSIWVRYIKLEIFGEEQQDSKTGPMTINTFEGDLQFRHTNNMITADTPSYSKLLNWSNIRPCRKSCVSLL